MERVAGDFRDCAWYPEAEFRCHHEGKGAHCSVRCFQHHQGIKKEHHCVYEPQDCEYSWFRDPLTPEDEHDCNFGCYTGLDVTLCIVQHQDPEEDDRRITTYFDALIRARLDFDRELAEYDRVAAYRYPEVPDDDAVPLSGAL